MQQQTFAQSTASSIVVAETSESVVGYQATELGAHRRKLEKKVKYYCAMTLAKTCHVSNMMQDLEKSNL